MFNRSFANKVLPILLLLAVAVLVVVTLIWTHPGLASGLGMFQSPLEPPSSPFHSPLPAPISPPLPSEAARKALTYVAQYEGIPTEVLSIVADHPTEYPALGQRFQVVILMDNRPEGQVYKLLVDLSNGRVEEDISTLLAAEGEARQARYGKLQPALFERLQILKNNDVVPVAVWVAAQPGRTLAEQQETAFAALAAKYPAARAALERSGKPMDVDNLALAHRIEAEYATLLAAEMKSRVAPVVGELERQGFTVTTYEGMPSFTAVLPKSMIVRLSQRDDVDVIYLIEAEEQPALDSAVPTSLAPTVWGRGYDGSGVTIAILEHGNVDPSNNFLNLSPNSRAADNGVQDHTTRVASDAASFHDTYRGIAPGATILSAGENGQQDDVVTALQWALDQGANVSFVQPGHKVLKMAKTAATLALVKHNFNMYIILQFVKGHFMRDWH